MRRFFIFTVITLFSLFLIATNNIAHASIECESFAIAPPSGNSGTLFTITGVGCDPGYAYKILVDDSSGETIMNQDASADENGKVVFKLIGIPEGTFDISVGSFLDTYWSTTITVAASTTPTEYKCGDIIPQSSHDVDTTVCPVNCPASESTNTGNGTTNIWHCACGDLNQAPCPEGNPVGLPSGCREGQLLDPDTGLCKIPVSSFEGICTGVGTGISTAIGCIPFDQVSRFSSFFITWGLSLGGGFSILVFIVASFLFITSSGDPTKLTQAKDLVLSAIAGIIFLVFSIFLLRLIGVNILGLF